MGKTETENNTEKKHYTKDSFIKILYILITQTDEDNPLSQEEIQRILLNKYEDKVEIKTVSENLKKIDKLFRMFNIMAGDDKVSLFGEFHHGPRNAKDDTPKKTTKDQTKKDYSKWYKDNYIKHLFKEHELRLLIDMVSSADYMKFQEREYLLNKLYALASDKFIDKYESYVYQNVSGNKEGGIERIRILGNLKVIHNAIKKHKLIEFNYLTRKKDKKLEMLKDANGDEVKHIVSPYRTVFNDGFYYLIGNEYGHDDLSHFRIDRILMLYGYDEFGVEDNTLKYVSELKLTGNLDNGNLKKYVSTHRTMWSGKPERITFKCPHWALNEVADYFGDNYEVLESEVVTKDDKEMEMVRIKVESSINSMRIWAYRFMDFVEIQTPKSLREEIRNKLKERYEAYCD